MLQVTLRVICRAAAHRRPFRTALQSRYPPVNCHLLHQPFDTGISSQQAHKRTRPCPSHPAHRLHLQSMALFQLLSLSLRRLYRPRSSGAIGLSLPSKRTSWSRLRALSLHRRRGCEAPRARNASTLGDGTFSSSTSVEWSMCSAALPSLCCGRRVVLETRARWARTRGRERIEEDAEERFSRPL